MTEAAWVAESVDVVEVEDLGPDAVSDAGAEPPRRASPRRPIAGRIVLGAGLVFCVAAIGIIAWLEALRPQRYDDIALTGTLQTPPGGPSEPCELHIDVTPARDAVGRVFVACGGVQIVDAPRSASNKARTTTLFAPASEHPDAVNGSELRLEWTGALAGDARGTVSIDTSAHRAQIVVERPGEPTETWRITLASDPRPPRLAAYF